MKQLLITIAALVLVGCGESQQSAPANKSEPPTTEVSDISIHEAAKKGNIEAVKQHIAAGTDVNAQTRMGTPLFYAALMGHKEIAELLIIKGANVNAKLATDETPLDNAINHGHPETANLLRKHGGKTGEELKAEGK